MLLADISIRTCVQEEMNLQRIAQSPLVSLSGNRIASKLFHAMQTLITTALYPIGSESSSLSEFRIYVFTNPGLFHFVTLRPYNGTYEM